MIALAVAPPLEDEGLFSGSYFLVQDTRDARLPLREVQRLSTSRNALGQDVRQLGRSGDVHELHVAILDHFVGEVRPNV